MSTQTFTKADLIDRLVELDDIESKAAASRVVELIFGTVKSEIGKRNEVKLAGFINLYPAIQPAKSGKIDGKAWTSAEKHVVRIKPTAQFKASINA